MIKLNQFKIEGNLIKSNEVYDLYDNQTLENLILSQTILKPEMATNGHSHTGQEEIYFFISGRGVMTVGKETLQVAEGDIILIPDGAFHRVYNSSSKFNLIFNCVFNGQRKH